MGAFNVRSAGPFAYRRGHASSSAGSSASSSSARSPAPSAPASRPRSACPTASRASAASTCSTTTSAASGRRPERLDRLLHARRLGHRSRRCSSRVPARTSTRSPRSTASPRCPARTPTAAPGRSSSRAPRPARSPTPRSRFPGDATQNDAQGRVADEIKKLAPNDRRRADRVRRPGVRQRSSRRRRSCSASPSPSSSSSWRSARCWPWACRSAPRSAGIAAGAVALTLLSNVFTMPDFATTIGVMIGLGVGIDYALFIVTRYRENLHHGHSVGGVDLAGDRHVRAAPSPSPASPWSSRCSACC